MKKILITTFMSAVLSASMAHAAETISGPPQVLDSTTMVVRNTTVKLDHIHSLKPGAACVWKNRPLDCGVLATAGLKDLVAGADVVCLQNTSGNFTCKAGGYDLAYGLIHAGWAVPGKGAPARYFSKQERTKKRKLGLWGAKNSDGKTMATLVTR